MDKTTLDKGLLQENVQFECQAIHSWRFRSFGKDSNIWAEFERFSKAGDASKLFAKML